MREVTNDTQSTITLLEKTRYGSCVKKYTLEAGAKCYLPLFRSARPLIETKSGREVYIYEGEGELHLSECYTKYDFSGLNAEEIDYYLQHSSFLPYTKYKTKARIEKFVELLDINSDSPKLLPPLYEELESELLEC